MNAIVLKWVRRLFLIVIPLILVGVEWHHPSSFSKNVYQGLAHQSLHWRNLHIFQSFLFGGVIVGVFILTLGIDNIFATLSRIFFWIFGVSYLVFDATAGIAVGAILEIYHHNPDLDLVTVKKIVQPLYNDSIVGGNHSLFSLMGSWTWLLGMAAAIIALFLDNQEQPVSRLFPPLLLLSLSACALNVGHYPPYGPVAFACLAAASLWFEVFQFGPAKKATKY